MQPLYFDEYELGMSFQTSTRTVTWYDVSAFVGLCGYSGPLWLDVDYVSQEKYHSGRLVPGLLVLSMAEGGISSSGILSDRELGLVDLTPTWGDPVLAGETIATEVEVVELDAGPQSDRGLVTTNNIVRTTKGKTALTYRAVRVVKTRSFDQSFDQ